MNKLSRFLLLLLLPVCLQVRAGEPLIIVNGDFDSPGDTWTTGGGVPDGWLIENHAIEKGTGGAKGTRGTVGLNHRWHGMPNHTARSLYLTNPQEAMVEQVLQGTMVSGVTYTLQYGYFRYANAQASITASLMAGKKVLASQTFTGEEFPHRNWKAQALTHIATAKDENLPVTVRFEITGQGDVRLDGVRILTTTRQMALLDKQLAAYTGRIAKLPGSTDQERQKKAILSLALERAITAREANQEEESQALSKDIDVAIDEPIQERPEPKLSTTLLPELKTLEGNPYLESLYQWADEQLKKPDIRFKKSTMDFSPFTGPTGTYGSRNVAADMNSLYWLAVHPQSKYKGHPELIARLLYRVHTYVDAHMTHGNQYQNVTNDFFAIGPAVAAMLKTRESFPDLLLPSDKTRWDAMVNKVNDFWLNEVYKKTVEGVFRMGHYANRDLGVANILLASGLYLNDEESLSASRKLVNDQLDNLYEDGAIAYIGTQTESCGYHGADIVFLARYYHLSGQTEALDLIKKTEWYAPISVEPGNVSDFWTAPSWKHTWNTGFGFGGEAVVGLTGNRYERALLDRNITKCKVYPDPISAMWYRNDIEAAPLPDHYAIFDRNIQGPRGRFGSFSYAANLRVPNNDEPGNITLMGAMTTEKDNGKYAYPLEAVLANIMPKVFVETSLADRHKRPDWASLSCRDQNGVSMGRDWSAFHSLYQLHVFGSSRKGAEVPWNGTQLWLCIGNRLFGLLEVAPQGEQESFEVAMAATLGVGGRGKTRPKDLQTLSRDHWSLGSLNLAILDHNFESVRVVDTKIRTSNASQIVCSTRSKDEPISERGETTSANSKLKTYTADDPHFTVVEVFAGEVKPKPQVKRIAKKDLRGLSVMLGAESYTLLLNCGDKSLMVDLNQFRLKTEGAWIHYPRNANKAPSPLEGLKVLIPAGEHRVILSGQPAEQAQQTGWETFEAMVHEKESHEKGMKTSFE